MANSLLTIKPFVRKLYYLYPRWRYLRKASKGVPVTVALSKGITIRLYPWGQIAEDLSICGFENAELLLTVSFLREGMNVIDVGANIGLYSILASKVIGESGRVWAFEPSNETYEHLLKNLSLNSAGVVIPNKLALADISDGNILLKRSPGRRDAERYLSLHPNHPSIYQEDLADPGDSELVKVTNLDSYMEKNLHGAKEV